jgi:TrmH RNA methyltransferase
MMRSCAHFGVKGVLLQDAAVIESGAAVRTAEGGAEHVQPLRAIALSRRWMLSAKPVMPL